mmetsp:Transcript_22669/g.25797  ORF Transcript_22669/g.25797 Transcript_22669/m.25797 type:complete len:416 (-) Transcript_22669:173-1420(-)|eukprot:CAMPEP_0194155358 /NCGR_PEP_ID=MMETSP0152-20130528/64211_1 /TAXON_ID=1049557 /ORGANISM="Thalassiothrix antarctica, Strain L6-D1" /LENGTH=415 /DNA_ID=CAMNT_0038862153 /DNA_START=14 /DNA_END=1261 /DNA_ORIENTATION=-
MAQDEITVNRSRVVCISDPTRPTQRARVYYLKYFALFLFVIIHPSVGFHSNVLSTIKTMGRVASYPIRRASFNVCRRATDDDGGELFTTSRRSILSGGVAIAGGSALWQGNDIAAFAATGEAAAVGQIGEAVISGGPLPLTVGLGTGPPYEQQYVEAAIDAGYRLFDTAQEYGSEEAIGNALKNAFKSGKLKRKDVFVTTKVDIDNMGYERTIESMKESYDSLGRLEGGIDLVLIHWPCPFVSKDEPGAILKYTKLRQKTWEALEQLQRDGVAKAIGVSNFGERHLKELLGYAKIRPVVNQVEVHPYNQRMGLEKLVKSEGIRFEAYSPLGKGRIRLFEDPVLTSIASVKKKSIAAVILRWLLQRGITPIPLSRNKKRLKENLNVFEFSLTDDEMRAIAKLDRGQFVLMDDERLA